MPGRSLWGSTFVGPEPVAMAAEDDNRVQDLVTPAFTRADPRGGIAPTSLEWGGCDNVDMDVHTRIRDAARIEDEGIRARFACAAEGERDECRCSY